VDPGLGAAVLKPGEWLLSVRRKTFINATMRFFPKKICRHFFQFSKIFLPPFFSIFQKKFAAIFSIFQNIFAAISKGSLTSAPQIPGVPMWWDAIPTDNWHLGRLTTVPRSTPAVLLAVWSALDQGLGRYRPEHTKKGCS
jgi:hypothetical protein